MASFDMQRYLLKWERWEKFQNPSYWTIFVWFVGIFILFPIVLALLLRYSL